MESYKGTGPAGKPAQGICQGYKGGILTDRVKSCVLHGIQSMPQSTQEETATMIDPEPAPARTTFKKDP